jgi:hypothetical protein
MVARSWMVVTALLHLSIGVTAFSLLLTGSDGGGSSLARWLSAVMSLPGGRLIIGLFGIAVVTVGLYFFDKGWNQRYRKYLRANHFTRHWNWLLKAGLIAKGAVVAVVGILLLQAAWRADPGQAGGVEKAFSWLTHQPYGWFLVVTICVGLLCFAFYCFVNAAHRTVPKVDGDIGTLAARLRTKLAI